MSLVQILELQFLGIELFHKALNRLVEHNEFVVETFFFFTKFHEVCFVLLNRLFQRFVFAFQFEYLLFLLKELFCLLVLNFG